MKKLQIRFTYLALIASLSLGFLFTSCSKDKDDDVVRKGKIDDAVGTYKGVLYHRELTTDFFDAIVIVTKEGNDKLKITPKAGEVYSNITPREFTVEVGDFFSKDAIDVVSLIGSVGGYFHYYGEGKTINVSSSKLQNSDIEFEFEGSKQ